MKKKECNTELRMLQIPVQEAKLRVVILKVLGDLFSIGFIAVGLLCVVWLIKRLIIAIL